MRIAVRVTIMLTLQECSNNSGQKICAYRVWRCDVKTATRMGGVIYWNR